MIEENAYTPAENLKALVGDRLQKTRNGWLFDGDLDLFGSQTWYLPDNLTVTGSLILFQNPIVVLPDNLDVGDTLDIRYTNIAALPETLKVGRDILAHGTAVRFVPPGARVRVGGQIFSDHGVVPMRHLPDASLEDEKLVKRFRAIGSPDLPLQIALGVAVISGVTAAAGVFLSNRTSPARHDGGLLPEATLLVPDCASRQAEQLVEQARAIGFRPVCQKSPAP